MGEIVVAQDAPKVDEDLRSISPEPDRGGSLEIVRLEVARDLALELFGRSQAESLSVRR
jgi:hypothetical protein